MSTTDPQVTAQRVVDPETGDVTYVLDMDPETFSVLQAFAERCDPDDSYFTDFRKALLPESMGGVSPYPFELCGARYVVMTDGKEMTDYIRTVK
jgi:hypothetical protein